MKLVHACMLLSCCIYFPLSTLTVFDLLWNYCPCCQVESLEDMRRFVTEHSDFTKLQSNVSKHVNVMSELSEIVSHRSLLDVSMVSPGWVDVECKQMDLSICCT